MQKRISRVFISARERACVSYANIATFGGFCDIDLTIVKATSPDDSPLQDKYVLEILKIFSISSSSYRAFTLSFVRRFGRTRSWRVALKCLLLLHRLLRSLSYDSPFRTEILWARTNGLFSLYPCNFCDYSSSSYEDYTTLVRSYAHLLDEILDYNHIQIPNLVEQVAYEESSPQNVLDQESSPQKPNGLGISIEYLPQLQSLIHRSIECRPTGAAARNSLVQSAMKLIVHDSFTYYTTFRKQIVTTLDNLFQLPNHGRVTAFSVYKKAAVQADQLSKFHEWSKSVGHCESHEYPFIDRILQTQVYALETFLGEMWQSSNDQSSSSSMSTSTSDDQQFALNLRDGDSGYQVVRPETEFDQVKKDMEMEALIKCEDDSSSLGWEDLLEASIITTNSLKDSRYNGPDGNYFGGTNGWKIQEYNSCAIQSPNPFYEQTQRTYWNYKSCPSTPMRSLIDL